MVYTFQATTFFQSGVYIYLYSKQNILSFARVAKITHIFPPRKIRESQINNRVYGKRQT